MSWEHLKALIWVRSRIFINVTKKSGFLSFFIAALVKILFFVSSIGAFLLGLTLGLEFLPEASPAVYINTWTIIIVLYLFFTMVGVTSELQTSDILSLDKFMHLPVSLSGAFLVNYFSSSLTLGQIVFSGLTVGITLGLVITSGFEMILNIILIAAFLLMMTALIFQLKRWLASMMTNPRRRQMIIVIFTMLFTLLMMLPYIFASIERHSNRQEQAATAVVDEQGAGINSKEQKPRQRRGGPFENMGAGERHLFNARVAFMNSVLPPGWLAYGTSGLREGNVLSALLCFAGMFLTGLVSLIRSYQTTLKLYLGSFIAGAGAAKKHQGSKTDRKPVKKGTGYGNTRFLEIGLPGLSEQASVITLTGIKSLLRKPEMKLVIMSPLIMLLVFGGMLANIGYEDSFFMPTLIASGLTIFITVSSLIGVMGNMFAFDSHGFRQFILSPVPRRDILLGKNLSFIPLVFGLMLVTLLITNWLIDVRTDHLVGILIQTIPIYLIFCMCTNLLSILTPVVIKTGTTMPASGQGLKMFVHILAIFIIPIPILLTLMPLAIEYIMYTMKWFPWFPPFLVFEFIILIVVAVLYYFVLNIQAGLLYHNEHKILEVVTTRP